MKWFKRKKDPLDKHIEMLQQEMYLQQLSGEEYKKLMERMERLYKLKAETRRKPVSNDTLALVFGNLAGILLIVAYEQKHVMSSKGLTQILRPNQPAPPKL